jgi:hypothetical protein
VPVERCRFCAVAIDGLRISVFGEYREVEEVSDNLRKEPFAFTQWRSFAESDAGAGEQFIRAIKKPS